MLPHFISFPIGDEKCAVAVAAEMRRRMAMAQCLKAFWMCRLGEDLLVWRFKRVACATRKARNTRKNCKCIEIGELKTCIELKFIGHLTLRSPPDRIQLKIDYQV